MGLDIRYAERVLPCSSSISTETLRFLCSCRPVKILSPPIREWPSFGYGQYVIIYTTFTEWYTIRGHPARLDPTERPPFPKPPRPRMRFQPSQIVSDDGDYWLVSDSLARLTVTISPPPVVTGVRSMEEQLDRWLRFWHEANLASNKHIIPGWVRAAGHKILPEPGVLLARLNSESLCHWDLTAQNILVNGGGSVMFVDWGSTRTGPRWMDQTGRHEPGECWRAFSEEFPELFASGTSTRGGAGGCRSRLGRTRHP